MSDLETFRVRARAWLKSVAPTYGKAAQTHLAYEEKLALGLPGSTGRWRWEAKA